MKRIGASTLALWALCGTAFAAPGDHVRAGELEIIPDVDLGAEYRTNVYRSEDTSIPAANLRLAPGLTAALEGEDHDFKASGEWELRKFFFVGDDAVASDITSGQRIQNLDRFNEFSIGAGIDTFKRNVVGFRLSDDMALQNWRADAEFADLPYSSQFRNNLAGGVRINPGPALEFVPGASWTYDSFQVPRFIEGGERALNQRNTYGPSLAVKWAFLPRTALVFNATYQAHTWQQSILESSGFTSGSIALPNSQHIKVLTGVDGRFTEKLFLQLNLGYGSAFYNEGGLGVGTLADEVATDVTGIQGLLVKAMVRYDVTQGTQERPGTKLSAGYVKDFRDSFFTNFVSVNSLFVQYNGRLGEFQPMLKYEFRVEDYSGQITRNDLVNRFTGDMSYWFRDWASATAGMWWQQRASDVDNVEYDDFNIHLLATFVY